MKQENSTWFILFVIVAAVLMLNGGHLFAGFTTLQLTSINFLDTNDPILGGNTWALTVVPLGMSQWVEGSSAGGTIPAEDISDSGNIAQRDLKIDIINHEQKCSYLIETDYTARPIYNFGGQLYGKTIFGGCDVAAITADCQQYGKVLAIGAIGSSFNCGCFYGTLTSAQIGTIPTEADRLYNTEVSVSNGVNTYKANINNWQTGFAQLGNVAYVQGIDLSSGLSCPSGNQYRVMGVGSQWRLISASNYDTYKNLYDNYFVSSGFSVENVDHFWSIISNLNAYSNNAQSETTWCKPGYGCAAYKSGSYYFTPDKSVSNPIIQFYVKADWLGVVQPEGVPDITCIDKVKNIGGSGGSLKFEVKNIGSGRGTAEVSVDCETPVSQDGGSINIYLQSGESKTSAIGIKTDKVDHQISISCEVKARILSNTDSCFAQVTVNPDIVCTPLERTCRQNAVQECNPSGTAWTVLDQCSGTEVCQFVSGEATCVSNECTDCLPDECNCHTWDLLCRANCKLKDIQQGIGSAVLWGIIILIVIVAIIVIIKIVT